MKTVFAGAEWMKPSLLTSEISCYPVISSLIRMKLSDIFPETQMCRKKKREMSWCNWGGNFFDIFTPFNFQSLYLGCVRRMMNEDNPGKPCVCYSMSPNP